MSIHEYQGKEVLRQYGVATPRGFVCRSPDEAAEAASRIGGRAWVVKAQIHAGGRGKGGGVKQAWSVDEVRRHAGQMLGMTLQTPQTGPEGRVVKQLLVEESVEIDKELYLGFVVDRNSQRVALMASSEGGMDIEEVAARTPEKIHRLFINPDTGLGVAEADGIARRIGIADRAVVQARVLMQNLWQAFDGSDASLAEINPLVLTRDGRVIALDAKFDFDDNALFRQPDIVAMRDLEEEDPLEIEASDAGLSYIALDGDIGCLVNGAGLAMATMDAIKLYGGEPANFLDVGGGATADKVAEAVRLMLRNPRLKAVLVNIFGGIMKCDVIAHGVVDAVRETGLKVPLIVRMKGTNEDLGRTILAQSGLSIINADDMAEAAQRAIGAASNWERPR
ncbi:ADP-forming succinate--CoA ligase subunit beta [Variovorax guangxiensis]|uniref:Succinate--CoA ligase [ADP-forming] subunit beta n=1 Tax=Variovorax guangxiensis TaxID=1775474 RepID=A0A3S1F323_9BURK|nr:ADP-forming succinate--CoA ligase subunit beta [Variovorax guangxiensis]RUR69480.1 ADP-forming succinate--CoA ligase subunit beta [Variovorax guangxiensis]